MDDVLFSAGNLGPTEIMDIRDGTEYREFLSALRKSYFGSGDRDGDDRRQTQSGALLLAVEKYRNYLRVYIGSRNLGKLDDWQRLRADTALRVRLDKARTLAGFSLVIGKHLTGTSPGVAGDFLPVLAAVSASVLKPFRERQLQRLTEEATGEFTRMRGDSGRLEFESYGSVPVDGLRYGVGRKANRNDGAWLPWTRSS